MDFSLFFFFSPRWVYNTCLCIRIAIGLWKGCNPLFTYVLCYPIHSLYLHMFYIPAQASSLQPCCFPAIWILQSRTKVPGMLSAKHLSEAISPNSCTNSEWPVFEVLTWSKTIAIRWVFQQWKDNVCVFLLLVFVLLAAPLSHHSPEMSVSDVSGRAPSEAELLVLSLEVCFL